MKFCPKCGSILMMKTSKYGCPRCDYVTKEDIDMNTTEKMEEHKEVAVVGKESEGVNPETDYPCLICKNKRSYFWIQQMRSGDEPESRFYKCTKCGNTVRVDN
jgi:transcription factor S